MTEDGFRPIDDILGEMEGMPAPVPVRPMDAAEAEAQADTAARADLTYFDVATDRDQAEAVMMGECSVCYGAGAIRNPSIPMNAHGFGGYPCPSCKPAAYERWKYGVKKERKKRSRQKGLAADYDH